MTTTISTPTIDKVFHLRSVNFSVKTIARDSFRIDILHKATIQKMIVEAEQCDNYLRRDTGKHIVHSFTKGYRSFSFSVEISNRTKKEIKLVQNLNNPCDYLTASDLWDGAL